MTFAAQLKSLSACDEAVRWVADRDLESAWAQCEQGDWMLWLAAKANIDRKLLVQAACDCAETAWPYCKLEETLQAAMLCVHVTREWCEGRTDIEDVREARYAAYAAAAAAAAAYAADYAADADAAAYAAAYAAAAAAYAAAYAVNAADYAADAADAAARAKTLAKCADLVRARIPVQTVIAALAPV